MKRKNIATICTFAILGGATLFSFMLPYDLSVPTMMASPQTASSPDTITLTTLIRDLRESHPEINVDSATGFGSVETFAQWFSGPADGTHSTTTRDLTLTRSIDGVYEYLDRDDRPIDDALIGNEGASHDHDFTLAFHATFTYDRSAGQFIEIWGGDIAWLFVGGELVADSREAPYVALDRLGLVDGHVYDVHYFQVQRDEHDSMLDIRTNIQLRSGQLLGTVTSPFD